MSFNFSKYIPSMEVKLKEGKPPVSDKSVMAALSFPVHTGQCSCS